MKKILLLSILALAGCVSNETPHTGPDLSAAIAHNNEMIGSLSSAQADSAKVKEAIAALQASNAALHRLNNEMASNLDRADYKTALLLKK
jgi:hypothetical protein